jgi:4-amino-4-deoxy-L-arabinose transferase-like glycosyltransferase
VLFVIAFVVRLVAVLLLRDIQVGPVGISSADDVQFHRLAHHLAAGDGYVTDSGRPTSFRAPGWPLFLAGLYLVAGEYPPLVYLVLCLLGALSCVLTYLLARTVLAEPWARVAGWLACFYLGHIYFSTSYLSEALFVLLLTVGMWLFIRRLQGGGPADLVLAGLALGAATLVRPFALLLVPLLLPLLTGWRPRQWAAGVVPVLAFVVPFLALLLPWTYRNYVVHQRFVLATTNGGSTFYGGNNGRVATEPRYFGYWLSTTELPHRDLIEAQPDEVSHDKMEWQLGLTWLREHPVLIPWLGLTKFARMWWLPEFDPGRLNYLLRIVGHMPFLLLWSAALVCLVRDQRYRTPAWQVLFVTMLATVLTVEIFWGCTRFRDATLPVLAIYAALGAQEIAVQWRRWWARGERRGVSPPVLESQPAG